MCRSELQVKLAVLILWSLLLLCYGVGNVQSSTIDENSGDFHSLRAFKQGITDDPNGALSNWNSTTHLCRWNGVTCTKTPPFRVTELNLYSRSLAGTISSSLGNLTVLKTLDLSNNSFRDPIPDALTNCSSLSYLDLSTNSLTGVIPPRIGLLSKLKYINLYSNNLTGETPPGLPSITTLVQIILGRNQLDGRIPDEIWQMPSIEELYLSENSLSGGIPHTLPNISSLKVLSLAVNMLSGKLPSNIGDALPKIQMLDLGINTFEGHIPASMGNPSDLQQIDLSSNNFIGQIPSSFGKLSYLSFLNLENNHLEARDTEGWEFFHALANCRSLNILSLTNNQLHGAIPKLVGNLSSTNLTRLVMGGNYLSGEVPSSIGNISGLIQLSLDYNNLTGTIDEWIGKLTNLQVFKVQSNKFSGIVPTSISYLTQMSELNLSSNNFQGSLPAEIGNLTKLNTLDLSSNQFTGVIPETLGQLVAAYTIQLDQNILAGNISCILGHLTSLNNLNLSHNSLSGYIPNCLNDLKLNKLDLSYNNFQGKVPTNGVFDNPTVVSLDGNPGLCGGAMDFHMPSCIVDTTRKVGLANYLVKILTPLFGFMSFILLVYFLLLKKKGSKRAQISNNSIGEHFENVTYSGLAQATNDFSEANMIGRGSYGSVYRGKLKESKMEVAVKVFNLEMRGAERSFLSECQALRSIRHRNLLPIITACSTIDNKGVDFKALVYELMPNGNLDMWLHHRGDEEAPSIRLGLSHRISIAENVADALDYLHHDCGRPTVHRDLKPSNILLDDDKNALLGDFGIARFYADLHSAWAGSVSSIGVMGTFGYIPPEYGAAGHVSTSGDVYSFGIVLLEIITGKRPTDPMFVDGLDIISFVNNSFPEQMFRVIDAYLIEECKTLIHEKNVPEDMICTCLMSLLQVALSCTRLVPSERSNMKEVASKIKAIKKSIPGLV